MTCNGKIALEEQRSNNKVISLGVLNGLRSVIIHGKKPRVQERSILKLPLGQHWPCVLGAINSCRTIRSYLIRTTKHTLLSADPFLNAVFVTLTVSHPQIISGTDKARCNSIKRRCCILADYTLLYPTSLTYH